jgi:hypothetical protein
MNIVNHPDIQSVMPFTYTDFSVQDWINLVEDYLSFGDWSHSQTTPIEAVSITFDIPIDILQGIINGQITYQQTGINQSSIHFIPNRQRRNQ